MIVENWILPIAGLLAVLWGGGLVLGERKLDANGRRERAIAFVLSVEGGIANTPHDRGGATRYGITRPTWAGFRAKHLRLPRFEKLTPEDAKTYYRDLWRRLKLNRVPGPVALVVFDEAVNSGPGAAAKSLALRSKTLSPHRQAEVLLHLRRVRLTGLFDRSVLHGSLRRGLMNRLDRLEKELMLWTCPD